MKMGTKSLLIGAHQFIWHPLTLFMAWVYLYREFPGWKECVCMFIHDWGYWGLDNMEGEGGEKHPYLGANLAWIYLDRKQVVFDGYSPTVTIPTASLNKTYFYMCLFHSRTLADKFKMKPSRLCRVDKLSAMFERWWIYLPRVWLSGEWREYRAEAAQSGVHPATTSDIEWFNWARERMIRKALNKDVRPPYKEGS
jgi:hypothetical protein